MLRSRSLNVGIDRRPALDGWTSVRVPRDRLCFPGLSLCPYTILGPRGSIASITSLPVCKAAQDTRPSPLAAPPAAASSPGPEERHWAPLNGRTAVIAGAGPAGCTLAMHLARAGWRVRVYEKRPEPGPATSSRQRSWVLAMYPRGLRPVAAVAEVPLLRERAYKGLVVGAGKPGSKPIVLERTGVLIDRTLVATSLLDAARGMYGSRVEFTFGASLESVDFRRRVATFRPTAAAQARAAAPGGAAEREIVGAATATASGTTAPPSGPAQSVPSATATVGGSGGGGAWAAAAPSVHEVVPYDLLVGADGSSSTLRSLLGEAFPGQYDTKVLGSPGAAGTSTYKSVYGLPPLPEVEAWAPDSAVPVSERLPGEFFLVLSLGDQGFLSMCRDIDGTYCGYLAAKEELLAAAKSPEAYLSLLPQLGPQLPPQWLPLLADKLARAPLSNFPVMRSLRRFWAPGGVVLVGDAAHTVTPVLGQGLNSALEDCETLAGELRGRQGDAASIDAALRRFSETRVPQISALQELELLQSSALTPLSSAATEPLPLLQLLGRKWVVLQYSGLALLGTIAATVQAANRKKQAQQRQQQRQEGESQPAGGSGSGGGGNVAAAAVEAEARADVLGVQLDATYVRSPPMYELLRGHMSYQDMLVRVYGMAALGTGASVALLYGIFVAVGAVAARALAG